MRRSNYAVNFCESLKSKIISNKELRDLINYSSLIDETYINFDGNSKHKFSKILKSSLKKSLALDSKINNEIKQMNGLKLLDPSLNTENKKKYIF